MKKIIFFLSCLYLNFICPFLFFGLDTALGESSDKLPLFRDIIFWIWFAAILLTIVSYLLNIVLAVKDLFTGDMANLRKSMILIKIGTIPFFILNFVLSWGFIFGIDLLAWLTLGAGMLFAPMILGVAFVAAVFVLALTSLYSILFLVRLKRAKRISSSAYGLHIFLQLFFIADLIGVLILGITYSKEKNIGFLADTSEGITSESK